MSSTKSIPVIKMRTKMTDWFYKTLISLFASEAVYTRNIIFNSSFTAKNNKLRSCNFTSLNICIDL